MFCDSLGYWFEWDKVELVRISKIECSKWDIHTLERKGQNCREKALGHIKFDRYVLDEYEISSIWWQSKFIVST